MNRRSARVVPVVPAQEAAARPQVVAPPHRTRPIRVQGDAAEFADADEVAGGGVEEVGVGVRIPLRLHLLSPAGRPTVALPIRSLGAYLFGRLTSTLGVVASGSALLRLRFLGGLLSI